MIDSAGRIVLRCALAGSLLWVGALKFAEYEAENIEPMVSTSPLFSWDQRQAGFAEDSEAHRDRGEGAWRTDRRETAIVEGLGRRQPRGRRDVPEHPQFPPYDAWGLAGGAWASGALAGGAVPRRLSRGFDPDSRRVAAGRPWGVSIPRLCSLVGCTGVFSGPPLWR